MIKSRLKNTFASAIWCSLFLLLAQFNVSASPPSTNCNCILSITSSSSCSGSNSGSATATTTNGTSPYTYRWSNNATGATATGLASGTYTVTATDKTGCTVSQSVTISSVSFSVNAGSDKTICVGSSTQLGASGASLYSWSPTTGLSNSAIANPLASPTVTTTYTVTGAVSSGELVTNGNFSSGNTGFTSSYGYVSPPGNGNKLNPEGLYAIDANANSYHGNFFGTGRGGSGNFMIINGATVAGVNVWRQTVSVTPNTTYYFSTWITALNNLVSANLAFSVNGVLMGPVISSPSSPNSWVQFYAVWNSGSATSAVISIVNQNTIANGNDFGLDDISFTTVCEKTDQVVVTVNSATANAGPDVTVCTGQSTTLTATGGGTYAWSTGATTASITVNPSSTTTYTVTVTNNGCTATDQVKVTRISTKLSASIAKTDEGCKKDSVTTCVLTLATSQHGLWLDDIPSSPSKYHKIVGGSMTATKYSDGRLKITGTFENVSDVNRKWTIDVMYTNKMNWTEFSTRGGTWKGTAGNVGTNYLNWDYYIMDVTYANKLTGSGTYAGKTLNLTHMPSNYLYGFQVGLGANDQTADWGMSGWFEHTGSYHGNGDINFDAVCDSTEFFQSSTCNGTADLSISGGTAPITYAWSNGRTTQDLTGLCAGAYTVTITEGSGCTSTQSVTVGTTSALTVACNSTDVTTQGGSNGTASVTVTGGVTPYRYLWSTGHTTQSVTNRPAGVYSVSVTDKFGCEVEYECCIKQPSTCEGFRTQTQGGWGASPSGGNPGTYVHANFAIAFPSGLTVGCATSFTLKLTSAQAVTDFLPSGSTARALTANLTNPGGSYSNVLAGQVVALSLSVGFDNANPNFGLNTTPLQNLVVASGTFANWTVAQVLAEANKKLGGCSSTYSFSQLNEVVSKINENYVDGSSTGSFLICGIDLATVKVDVKCFGQHTGSIDLTPSGGVLPYAYSWSNGATTQDLTNVGAGTYSVTVTAANNLTATTSVTIAQPTQLSLTTTKTDLNCNGVCTGAASVTATGGTAPYTYKWNTNATTASISNLCAGTFTVTVTDANNCTAVKTATLTQSADLVSSITKTDVSCGSGNIPCKVFQYGAGSHAVYLPHLGLGSASWVFGAQGGTIETFANGTARIYGNIYYISDTTKSFFLDFNFSNKMTWAQWSALGRGWKGDAGIVGNNYQNWDYYIFSTTTPSTLTGRISYTGNNLNITHNPSNYQYGLQIGLAANDKNGSYGLSTWFNHTGWKSGNGDINANLVCAQGQCDGTTDVTVSGGTAPYTYSWNTGASSQDLSGLCPGTYTIIITDSKGCKDTLTTTIVGGSELVLNATGTNIACAGVCNGTATVTASGGSTPYTYLWSNGATTQSLSNICAGTYIVTVTDNKGCFGKDTVVITANPKPEISSTASPVNCFGASTGSIITTVTGGTSPFTYVWTPSGATTANLSNVTAGTYSVILTDVNGCKDTASATITQPADSLNGIISSTPVSCIGGTDGTATVVASGGTGPYTYAWSTSPSRTTAAITGLRVGSYTVTITDAKGCVVVRTVSVTGVPPLTIGSVPSPVLCNGGNTGSINLTISGGTPSYTYLWSNGATTEDITGLIAGTYNVTVTDRNGCVATAGVTVGQPQPLVATGTPVNIACFGANNGGVNVSVVGGTSPFTYFWSNGATTRDITGVVAGTFTVTVTDRNGCVDTASATVSQQSALQVTPTPTNVTCFGFNNGSITLAVNGGVTPYTYNWGAGQPTTANRSNLAPGTYNVTVTDANNCTSNATATITQPTDSLNGVTSSTPVSCIGGTDGTATAVATGGTAPYTYVWSTTPARTTASLTGLRAGSYTVTITDAKGCIVVRTVVVTTVPALTVGAVPSPVLCFGSATGAVNATISGGTPGYTFLWSNGATTEDLSNVAAGTYNVTVTDSKGCVATAGVTVQQPQALVATATPTNIPCFGSNTGSVTLSVVGGTTPFTYIWSNGTTTRDITALSAGTYTVTVTDKNGCKDTVSATVTAQPSLVVDVTGTNLNCYESNTGSATASVTGGLAPYNYTWNTTPVLTSATITGLSIGTYSVTVTDANGCTATDNVLLTQPDSLEALTSCNAIACFGDTTADIVLLVAGGTTPYTYLWSTGATTRNLDNQGAGTYTVTVTDAKGCTITSTAIVEEPAQLIATASPLHIACNGAATGGVNLSVLGGTAPYTYLWSNGAATQNLTGLVAGTYTVTVTDKNGCRDTASATINQQSALQVTATATNIPCFGQNNGAITTSVNGGVGPYTYNWGSGIATANRSNLAPGNYTVTVTDANNCTGTASATVTQPADSLNGLTSSTPVSCIGGTDGTATLVASGGTAPYTYAWSTTPTRTTSTITGLRVGSYTVTITDSKGCTLVRTVIVTGVPPLTIGSVPSPVLCNGGNTGSINLTISGGTPGYTFQWSNGVTTEDITGLVAGTYNVTVTDRNGCVATAGVSVTQPQPLVASGTPINIACFGANNGGVNISVVGGTTPFNYIWSNGATTRDITGVVAGTYTVTVTDKNGCVDTASVTVTQQAALQVTATPADVTCFGFANGSIATTVNGGVAPYTYNWGAGQPTNANRSNLAPGTYNVTVTDANNCTGTATATITQPSAPLAATAAKTNVNCFGDATGTVTLTVTGGTTAYNYIWSNGATTKDLTGLVAGTYTATVTDAKGCNTTASATVTQPNAALSASATKTDVNCYGDATGTVTLTVTGGTTAYTYTWSNGATTKDLTGLVAGTYTVTVTDAKGCTATASATVTQPNAPLSASATKTDVNCFGGNNGTATLTVTGGTIAYTYLWSNGATSQNLTGLVAGTYTVTVTDAKACTTVATVTITQPADSLNGVSSSTPVSCIGGTDGTMTVVASGGTAPYTYAWSTTPTRTTATVTGLRVGSYSVTITDAKGCIVVRTVTVTGVPPLTIGSVPSPVLCFGGNTGSINLTISGGTPGYTFLWSNGATTEDINGLLAGTYSVTVTDRNGCVATSGVAVQQPQPLIPTATPVNIACFGANNGGVNLGVTGGTTPFTYAWSNGATTRDITGVVAGTYNVTITDKNNCTATASASVTQQAALQVSVTPTNLTCNGNNTGALTTSVNGGVAPYTYNWGAGQPTTANRNGLAIGSYTVMVTDANGCTGTASATITQPDVLTASATGSAVLCFGDATGTVTLTVNGGTAPFTYNWSNQATSQNLSGLVASRYNVTITDANGCTATASANVTEPTLLTAAAGGSAVSCFGDITGTITLNVGGGRTPYTYLWNTGATTKELNGVGAGAYTVTVTDANGCTVLSLASVTQPDLLVASGSNTNVLCNGASTATATLTVAGGTAPYTYVWSNVATTQNLTGLAAGAYTVTVTDANGCTATKAYTVTEPTALSASATAQDVRCFLGSDGAANLTITGGVGPYTYRWSNNATTRNLTALRAGN